MKRICVFCGSSKGSRAIYLEAAQNVGRTLAARDIELVYGGGCVGLMGAMADAAMEQGGHVIGVIPESLVAKEVAHKGLSDLRVVKSMHERKALMAELADAFVALPGGIGTFEELFEAMTWTQLGIHTKPVALLDVNDFWAPVLVLLDRAVSDGFLAPDVRAAVIHGNDPAEVLDAVARWQPPTSVKWSETQADLL